jgi:NADP-dependent 3-hydroxy acid dehydrogenase YdfG
LTHTALHQCKIGIIGDDELAPLLALQLQREGVNAHVVEDLSNIQADIQGLIDLTPLQVAAETVYSSAQQCFERAQVLVQRHDNDPKVFIVVSQLGGDFGQTSLEYSDCLQGGTAGVVRTAQQEWPNAHCKNIDIPPRLPINQQARMLVDEILFGGMDLDVGLNFVDSAVRRRTLTMTVREPTGQLCQFSRGDVLVVSGGGRGVTADCLIQMVHHYFDVGYIIPRIVLLGRTPLDGPAFDGLNTESEILKAILTQAKEDGKLMKPAAAKRAAQKVLSAREIQRTIQILENFGAEVRYLSVDVSDTEEVVALFQKLNWGPVTGIIHGAGVLADKAIKDKSSDDFAWVFDVKVQGMEALFNLLDQQYPKLAVFFSSVAARTGNAGQVDYAAANEVLNRVAHYTKQRFPHMCVRSIGWGPWEGGMVSPELARHFASRGVGLIPIRDGAEAFVRELTDESHVEVVIGADAGLDSANQIDSVSWSITPTTQDFLQGHTFQETVLVPMALVVSAFRRVAEQLGQGVRLNKLNVFNPVHIQDGLKIQHTSNSGRLQLMSVDGKPLYGVQLGTASNEPVSFNTIEEWEKLLTRDGIYDGAVLFHTDDFQVIDSLQVHRDAAMATISVNGPFSDVLALDAGLQLALHWMAYRTGLRSLPMSMDSIQWYSDASVTHVRLEGFSVENKVGRCDLFLLDADGSLVVHMQGVSVVGLVEATQ